MKCTKMRKLGAKEKPSCSISLEQALELKVIGQDHWILSMCVWERGEEKEGHEKTFLLTFCTICCLAINIELGIDNGRLRKITFKIFLYLLHFTLSLLRLHSESPGGKKTKQKTSSQMDRHGGLYIWQWLHSWSWKWVRIVC